MVHYRSHRDPKSSHQQILRHVKRLKKSPILDVGAAQGMLGQALQGCGLTIDAIEVNAEWANLARPHYRQVFNSFVEDADLQPNHYRVVVCGDVLEHVPQPERVLELLMKAATDDATFIISLPNVAHLAVRMMLLSGKFPQMERGILDRTHLHFYTRETAQQMLESVGLRVVWARPTGVPIDEIFCNRAPDSALMNTAMRAQHVLLRMAPQMFGYQWVFVARKRAFS